VAQCPDPEVAHGGEIDTTRAGLLEDRAARLPRGRREVRVPVLVVHGWHDYNVKQSEGIDLYEQIPIDEPATPREECRQAAAHAPGAAQRRPSTTATTRHATLPFDHGRFANASTTSTPERCSSVPP
jgi:hypothetical protein